MILFVLKNLSSLTYTRTKNITSIYGESARKLFKNLYTSFIFGVITSTSLLYEKNHISIWAHATTPYYYPTFINRMYQPDLLELDTVMEDLTPLDDQPLQPFTMVKKSKPSTVATSTSYPKSQPYTSKQYFARRKRFLSASSTISSSRNQTTKRH